MNHILNNISLTFNNLGIFPDSEIKLNKKITTNFEEVQVEKYVLKDGFYPIYYVSNFGRSCKYYNLKKKLHRFNGPADISYNKKGDVIFEKFYNNGVIFQNNQGPGVISYSWEFSGIINYKEYFRENNYSKREYFYITRNGKQGDIEYISYYKNGKKHNSKNKPNIHYSMNRTGIKGDIKTISYFKNGIFERKDKNGKKMPAQIEYFINKNGKQEGIRSLTFYRDGKRHEKIIFNIHEDPSLKLFGTVRGKLKFIDGKIIKK